MTTHRNKRCGHCGLPYSYQGSGAGCNRPENDGTFCPDCKVARDAAVKEAFAKIPRFFEGRWRDIKEMGARFEVVTLEKLKAWEAEDEAAKQASTNLFVRNVRRVFSPLFDLKTGDSSTTVEVRGRWGDPNSIPRERPPEYAGVTFQLTTWGMKPDYDVVVMMEWDLRENRFTEQLWR